MISDNHACLCSLSGNGHFFQFDGGAFDFQGKCSYTLAESGDSSDETPFKITLTAAPMTLSTSVVSVESMEVTVYNHIVRFSHVKGIEVMFDSSRKIRSMNSMNHTHILNSLVIK